jgi:hypothetical protein
VTTLVNSPVFWIGLLAGLGVLRVLPTVIAVFRRVENIAVVVFLTVCRLPGQPRLSWLA